MNISASSPSLGLDLAVGLLNNRHSRVAGLGRYHFRLGLLFFYLFLYALYHLHRLLLLYHVHILEQPGVVSQLLHRYPLFGVHLQAQLQYLNTGLGNCLLYYWVDFERAAFDCLNNLVVVATLEGE